MTTKTKSKKKGLAVSVAEIIKEKMDIGFDNEHEAEVREKALEEAEKMNERFEREKQKKKPSIIDTISGKQKKQPSIIDTIGGKQQKKQPSIIDTITGKGAKS